MKHIGNAFLYLILAVNTLFAGLLLLSAYSPWIFDPKSSPVCSCIGLVFPLFILINILFALFWMFTRPRYILVPIIAFLLCIGQIRTYIPINIGSDKVPTNAIKILSYNVMGFNKVNKSTRKEPNSILEYIKKKKPDIICLQEYQFATDRAHLREKDIKEALSDYPYYNKHDVKDNGTGNWVACFSKFPILSANVIKYKSAYNGSVIYELLVKGDTITLINNHLESNKLTKADKDVYEGMIKDPQARKVSHGVKHLVGKLAEASQIRAAQADSIANRIKNSKHQSIIVCGDFNDTPISYVHRVIAENLDDAFTKSGNGLGISYNQNKFYFRIDNILISKNLKAYNCTVDKKIKDSDHYPIWCYIGLN